MRNNNPVAIAINAATGLATHEEPRTDSSRVI